MSAFEVVSILNEKGRGCGYRKKGGTYLVTDATELQPCGKVPLPLEVCACCGQGIKPARAWTWVDAEKLFAGKSCRYMTAHKYNEVDAAVFDCHCPLGNAQLREHPRMGLLWVGEKFYATPKEFLDEGKAQGFSRRIPMIPKDFELGTTWVLFAHRKAIPCPECHGSGKMPEDEKADHEVECDRCEGEGFTPGIFFAFKPERVEYILKGDEKPEELERKAKRGITLVKLERTDAEDHNTEGDLFEGGEA